MDACSSNPCHSGVLCTFHLLAVHEGRTGSEGQGARFVGSLRREAQVCSSGLRQGAGWVRRQSGLAVQHCLLAVYRQRI